MQVFGSKMYVELFVIGRSAFKMILSASLILNLELTMNVCPRVMVLMG